MMAPTEGGPSLSIDGGVATILLDQKRRLNAMQLRTWKALPELMALAENEPSVRLILLRGAGGAFGAGNDIAELATLRGDPEAAADYARAMATAMFAVEATPKPVLVAIEGQCYGASVALALTGDIRIAADDATFAITPAKLGAMYLRSDLHRLVAAVGQGQSKMLIYSAQPIGAHRAQQIGLVDHVTPATDFEAEVARLVEAISRGSTTTLRLTKDVLRTVGLGPTPAETAESLALFVETTQGADFAEGVDAFLAKRRPRFA